MSPVGGREPDWGEVRRGFLLDPTITFMDAMLITSHPASVRASIAQHQRGLDRDPQGYVYSHEIRGGLSNHVAARAAAYLGLPSPEKQGPAQIALTDSTTMGLGLLYNGILLADDQRIVIPESTPFFTNSALSLRRASEVDVDGGPPTPPGVGQLGGSWERVERVKVYGQLENATVDEIVERILDGIDERTRVLGLTWVNSATGLKLPVPEICQAVQALNQAEGRSAARRVLTIVDGVHGFGVENVSFEELGCDFLVSGAHKWIFGPRGTGIVCGRPDAWEWVVPTIPAFRPGSAPGFRHSPGGIHSYAHRWSLGEAFDFHLDIGKKEIEERTTGHAAQLKKGLSEIGDVTVITPHDRSLSSGIVCCSVGGWKPYDLQKRLRRKYRISAMTSLTDSRTGRHYLRLSPSIINSPSDIDRVLAAVEKAASTDPSG